jgi:hypothetical protein
VLRLRERSRLTPERDLRLGTAMREEIDRLLAQTTMITLALGIALGWSIFQVAKGIADVVNGLLTDYPRGADIRLAAESQSATWIVGDRVLTLTSLIAGFVELGVVLIVAALILRRRHAAHRPG